MEGDALLVYRKGKRGCVFDLEFVAHWSAANGDATAKKGKCTVQNFANDGGSSVSAPASLPAALIERRPHFAFLVL